ncbi:MAG: transketolase [Actinomycetota bacterium]|nr:transketolase [Actinomycetota bacterium]
MTDPSTIKADVNQAGEAAEVEQRAINVIRGLAMDMPRAASSGHQGTAMALAPLAHVLWSRIMRFDPQHPEWPDRDRFVLSCGHASVLLYSMLHLTGYDLSLDDLKEFRQWGSRTPGHPEVHHTPGVEVTTGPLGQGFANGVGCGVAERSLRARFGADVCDHHTFVICSDGDLEEGISHEAASLAGHLGLGRLIYVYDDNHISIDGPTELALSDDAPKRFAAYGWDVNDIGEVANDCDALETAVRRAMAVEDAPSFIVLRSHIGYPSPKFTDSPKVHGLALDEDEIKVTKAILGLPPEKTFWVPEEVTRFYEAAAARGGEARRSWLKRQETMSSSRDEYEACLAGQGVDGWEQKLPRWDVGEKVATRVASGDCVNALLDVVPGLMAGGADLTGNTGTELKDAQIQSIEHPGGRQLHFGIREHGMGGIMNGIAMHGGGLPVGGTFLIFSDYMRGAVRLAALSEAHVVYSWTHDSVGLGEDGPTHQPIEQLAGLRAVPGLRVSRPADANETAMSWRIAVDHIGPTAMCLSRQDLPVLDGTEGNEGVLRGAYVLRESGGSDGSAPDLVLIGTGGEVWLCVDAAELLAADGHRVRVVSMPCWEDFSIQDASYIAEVLPPGVPRLAVEAACSFGWERWADATVSIDHFGASAPGTKALEEFGYTPAHVADAGRAVLASETNV